MLKVSLQACPGGQARGTKRRSNLKKDCFAKTARNDTKSGFTFLELLITLVVISISFLPLLNMFAVALRQSQFTHELTTAKYLAQEHIERLKNLYYTQEQLAALGARWDPPLDKSPFNQDQHAWRILTEIDGHYEPVKVSVSVFNEQTRLREKSKAKPVVELTTLLEDYEWVNLPIR